MLKVEILRENNKKETWKIQNPYKDTIEHWESLRGLQGHNLF